MPINLAQPLSWKSANVDEKAMLADLQGNILKGHGREHTLNIFLKLAPGAPARAWVKSMGGKVTSAIQQLQDAEAFKATGVPGPVFVGLYLTASGYVAVSVSPANIPSDTAFRAGLKPRSPALNDPAVTAWDSHFQGDIGAMLLIADSDSVDNTGKPIPGSATKKIAAMRKQLLSPMASGVSVLGEEIGLAMKNEHGDGIEHFGYVDGRSQPLLLVEDIDHERDEMGGTNLWDPAFGLRTALVACPGGSGANSFGSYFVFRKLEQNVKGFKKQEKALAKSLGLTGEDEERAGAMVVGRFEDGTPIAMREEAEAFHPVWNNFNFDADPNALKCPFQGHIRKANPRGGTTTLGATLVQERSHIMARRGITYGKRTKASLKTPETKGPTKDVGLLFMAFQSDIANQFEFTQRSWVNAAGFLKPGTGIDPVIGQAPVSPKQNWPKAWGKPGTGSFDFHGFVTMKGGEYFFAPSSSFLNNL